MILESVRQALGANPNMLCGQKPVDVVGEWVRMGRRADASKEKAGRRLSNMAGARPFLSGRPGRAGHAGAILVRLGKCDCHEPYIVIPCYAGCAAKPEDSAGIWAQSHAN